MKRRFFTNQQRNLVYMLAHAGVTDDAIRASSIADPILLEASDLDVTEHESISMIHFCRSQWQAAGFTPLAAPRPSDSLTFHPLVRLDCDPPPCGKRYSCVAELSFDEQTQAAMLTVLHFDETGPIPMGTNITLEGHKFVEHTSAEATIASRTSNEELVCST